MLSDLYSPDDIHALPAINTTDEQQANEEEESYDDEVEPDLLSGGVEGDNTAVALKVPVAEQIKTVSLAVLTGN